MTESSEPSEAREAGEPADAETRIEPAGAGAQLTAGRELAGWSLVQAADRLHLDVAMVKALEAGQFEALGAAVYARGHLRRYAELLGLHVSAVEAAYALANPTQRVPDLTRNVAPLDHSGSSAGVLRPWTVAVGAAIVVIAGLVWWAMRVPHTPRPLSAPPAADPPVDTARVPAAPTPDAATAPDPAATAANSNAPDARP
jgi:cytoskeletal protein RodZ